MPEEQKGPAQMTPDEKKKYQREATARTRQRQRTERAEKQLKKLREKDTAEARLAFEATSKDAARIKSEREEDVEYLLSGQAFIDFDLTPEEIKTYEQQVSDFLLPYEKMPFETMYQLLSLMPLGRLALLYYHVDPIELNPDKKYIIDADGIKEFTPWKASFPSLAMLLTESPDKVFEKTRSEYFARQTREAQEQTQKAQKMRDLEKTWKQARQGLSQ